MVRCIGLAVTVGTLVLAASGCGYLPSELTQEKATEEKKEKARDSDKPHAATSSTPVLDFRRGPLDGPYVFTGD